jgi:hypothetical protein
MIEQPALCMGLTSDLPSLPQRMVTDAGGDGDAVPLLAYTPAGTLPGRRPSPES